MTIATGTQIAPDGVRYDLGDLENLGPSASGLYVASTKGTQIQPDGRRAPTGPTALTVHPAALPPQPNPYAGYFSRRVKVGATVYNRLTRSNYFARATFRLALWTYEDVVDYDNLGFAALSIEDCEPGWYLEQNVNQPHTAVYVATIAESSDLGTIRIGGRNTGGQFLAFPWQVTSLQTCAGLGRGHAFSASFWVKTKQWNQYGYSIEPIWYHWDLSPLNPGGVIYRGNDHPPGR